MKPENPVAEGPSGFIEMGRIFTSLPFMIIFKERFFGFNNNIRRQNERKS